MLYRNYLEKLLGNRTKIAMLRSFYQIPNKIWSSRDLAKFIGIYNTTVLDNLVDLEEMGLVDIGMHGHVKTIKLNKESFVFTEIAKPLFEKEAKTFEALVNSLKSIIKSKDIQLFVLFGSIVERREKSNSDIDILIVTKNKESVDILLTEKQGYIVKMFGNELAPHIMSPAEFKEKQNAPFLREAKKNHIPIYGEWK